MNVLFLTLSNMENINERGIYTDLVRELAKNGLNMYVVFPRERRTNLPTELEDFDNIKILKVRTGNITEVKNIEKGISTLTIENQFLKNIKKFFSGVHFDLVLYATPPVTFEKVVSYFKKNHQSKTYLILKDIFPQNAVDISMVKEGSLIWKYFRRKEKKLYKVSDMIGCMSEGNVRYILTENRYIEREKIEIFPNAIEPAHTIESKNNATFEKFSIPKNSTLYVYGGNLGKPQGIEFLLKIIANFHRIRNGYLVIVGSGTEFELIEDFINDLKPKNVRLFRKIPKNEYDELLSITDVGLIFLDYRFTIPNIPSRLTDYMEHSLPVIAATDQNTDLKDIIIESNCGLWSESIEIESFITNAKKLAGNETLRKQMGENARTYLEENCDIRKTVKIILKHL